MNRALAQTIIHLLDDSHQTPREALRQFTGRDWQQTYNWLDASGMTLYLAQRLKHLQLENAVPREVTERFRHNLTDNIARTSQLFNEFVRINRVFQKLCLAYVVTKGFALLPDYCPDASLRCQLDFDFLVHRRDATALAAAMKELEYSLASDDGTTWHFKKGEDRLPDMSQLYQPRPQHAVELHFVEEVADGGAAAIANPHRIKTSRVNGFDFPVLSDVDAFVAHARHLFRHMRSEWTRASWVFELRRCISRRAHDHEFWSSVESSVAADADARLAIAAAIALVRTSFGFENCPAVVARFTAPQRIQRWLDLYWCDVLLTQFPGSKLYLILEREVSTPQAWERLSRKRLFPLHRAPLVVDGKTGTTVPTKLNAVGSQLRFIAFRTRFHVIEGLRYWRESRRWARATRNAPHAHVDLPAQIASEMPR